jgi:hypothetical protein
MKAGLVILQNLAHPKLLMTPAKPLRTFILLAVLIFSVPVCSVAQDTISKPHREPLIKPFAYYMKDTIVPAGKNEISFNVAPLLAVFSGMTPNYEYRYAIYYRRQLRNPQNFLRAGFIYKPASNYSNPDDLVFMVTDSTRYRNVLDISRRRPLQLNFGIERRSKGLGRWHGYIALDLVGGFYSQKYTLTDWYEKQDSTGNWEMDYSVPQPLSVLDKKTSLNYYFGASPAFGIRYAFNAKWLFSAQAGFEAILFAGEEYERVSQGYSLKVLPRNYFEFNTSGLINELSVHYRF